MSPGLTATSTGLDTNATDNETLFRDDEVHNNSQVGTARMRGEP